MPLITGASGRRYFVDDLAPGAQAVRFLRPGRFDYDQAIAVERRPGGELFLALWVGKPLGLREWMAARDDLFPDARAVSFKRCHPITGKVRSVTMPLPPAEMSQGD